MNKRFKHNKSAIVNLTKEREINANFCHTLRNKLHATNYLVNRIGLEAELKGHEGCVNCLQWSENGRLLASASDDTTVIIWDAFRGKVLQKIPTLHEGNIFTVKFLPNTSDSKIITGAADHRMVVHDVLEKETLLVCNCAKSRVKRIETCYDMPTVFWSASEDGLIRQIDTRTYHECGREAKNVLINLNNHLGNSAEAKCLAINPFRTEMLAVGANDQFVRMYDRRMIKKCTERRTRHWFRKFAQLSVSPDCIYNYEKDCSERWVVEDNLKEGCVQYFTPGHLRDHDTCKKQNNIAVTYLTFSPNGREILANFGSEQIYIFDTVKSHLPKYFTVPNVECTGSLDCIKNAYSSKNSCLNGHRRKCSSEGDSEDQCKSLTDVKDNFGPITKIRNSRRIKVELPRKIENLKRSAKIYLHSKKYSDAIKRYNEAILEWDSCPSLYCKRATAYMKRDWKGDIYAALRDCSIALELDSTRTKSFFNLTRCFMLLNKLKEAKRCLRVFKDEFPESTLLPVYKALEKDINDEINNPPEDIDLRTRNSINPVNPISFQVSYFERLWESKSCDYEQRYCGHCNTSTDIKEANFFGGNGQYIVAGSDEGSIYFWDRVTETIVHVLQGDSSIVNCLQPHPYLCFLASSGIDPFVRLWSPRAEDGTPNKRKIFDVETLVRENQARMQSDPLEIVFRTYRTTSSYSSDESQVEDRVMTCSTS